MQRNFWQYINRKNKTTVNTGDLKWKDGLGYEKMAEDTEKAAALEDFFTSVYTVETDNDFEPLQSRIVDRSGHSKMLDGCILFVEDTIDKLAKVNKSPGLDLLHPRVLYETHEVIAYPQFLILKKSILTLPSSW